MKLEKLQELLSNMQAQDATLSQALEQTRQRENDLLEQVMLTRGAVQMLEHLIDLETQDEGGVPVLRAVEGGSDA